MPKKLKSRGYDLDPNSIFGTSKMILQEYQKGLDREPITPIETDSSKTMGVIQGKTNPKTEGIFGEYNLMLKNLTNSLNIGTHYLEELGKKTQDTYLDGAGIRRKGGSGDYNNNLYGYMMGGSNLAKANVDWNAPFEPAYFLTHPRGGAKGKRRQASDRFKSREQALQYLRDKYTKVNSKGELVPKQRGAMVNDDDLQIAKYFNIYNVNKQSDSSTILVRYLHPPKSSVVSSSVASSQPVSVPVSSSDSVFLPEHTGEAEENFENEVGIEGSRFSNEPNPNIGVHGGDPYENISDDGSIEEEEAGIQFPNFPPHPISSFGDEDLDQNTLGFESLPSETRSNRYNFDIPDYSTEVTSSTSYNPSSSSSSFSNSTNNAPFNHSLDSDTITSYTSDTDNMNYLNPSIGIVPLHEISENYSITLMNNIASQVNKALDYWESEIRPVFNKISKIKVDSFIKGKPISDFEKAVKDFEGELNKQEAFNLLPDFIDRIADSIINSITDLFDQMNLDLKTYTSGMSSGSETPQLLGSGYVQLLRSPYGMLSHFDAKNFL